MGKGSNASKSDPLKLPAGLLKDYSPNGSLYIILCALIEFEISNLCDIASIKNAPIEHRSDSPQVKLTNVVKELQTKFIEVCKLF